MSRKNDVEVLELVREALKRHKSHPIQVEGLIGAVKEISKSMGVRRPTKRRPWFEVIDCARSELPKEGDNFVLVGRLSDVLKQGLTAA